MARTAAETSNTLIEIYEESFANDNFNYFRIDWPELRAIAGVAKLTHEYLHEVNQALNETSYTLIPLDNFLVVAMESDFSLVRSVPPRIVEQYLPGEDDDYEYEDIELDDDEDIDLENTDKFENSTENEEEGK